jgi:hypothetical protein
MQPDPPAAAVDMEGELGPVIVHAVGRCDRRVVRIQLGDSPESIANKAPPAGQLGVVVDVLELTAAALIAHIVGATRLNPVG